MRGTHLALLGAATASMLAACSVYDTSLFHAAANSGAGGGTAGGGGVSGAGASSGGDGGGNVGGGGAGGTGPCVLTTWPAPPDPSTIGEAGGNEEAVGVMIKIDLGDDKPDPTTPPTHYAQLGFDLDKRCSAAPNLKKNQECAIPSYGFGVPDGPGGIDNALGQVIQLTRNQIAAFSSDIYSTQLHDGITNVIVHLTEYNGQANDDQVTVETLVSAPFDSPPRTKGTKPKWDGTDEWPIASDSLKDGKSLSKPKFVDTSAYVNDHKVVVRLPKTALRLVTGLTAVVTVNLDVEMLGATIMCDLVPNTKMPRTWNWTAKNCVLGARWLANSLVHQLSQFPDPANNLPLCMNSQLYAVFRDNICGLVDVSDTPFDTPDDCTAISMGLTFDTEPGLIGNVFEVQPIVDKCAPGVQPSDDNCEDGPLSGRGGAAGATGSGGAGGAGAGGKGGGGGAGGSSGGTDAGTGPTDASTKG